MSLPQIDIIKFLKKNYDYTIGTVNIQLSNLDFKSGNISLFELFCICLIVKVIDPKLVMEFGTFDGRTTLNIAHNLSEEGRIITVDLPYDKGKEGSWRVLNTKYPLADGKNDPNDELGFVGHKKIFEDHLYLPKGKIQQVWSDTAKLNPFDSLWLDEVNIFFIDASHTFENCFNDSLIAYSVIKRPGLIIWHDYNGWPGVTEALNLLHEKTKDLIDMHQIKDTSLAVGIVTQKGEIKV